jgi:UDP-N-acetylmuramate dehydrogenase
MSAAACGFGYRTSRFKHADAGRYVVTEVEFALRRDGEPTVEYADVVRYFEARGGVTPTLDDVRRAIIEIRSRKGMVIREGNPANQSVGSFFVNPVIERAHYERIAAQCGGEVVPHFAAGPDRVKVPAAWLIEHAGFKKGYVQGRVGISPFQAQGLINRGGAVADEVVQLAVVIKRGVHDRFGVALVPEPVFIGFERHADARWLLDPAAE